MVNIGGIANVTILKKGENTFGFDTGPGNGILDAWCLENTGKSYDEEGKWAGKGSLDETLLSECLKDDFFERKPPKSTGKELFNLSWLRSKLGGSERAEDVQNTLVHLTSVTIARAILPFHVDEGAFTQDIKK